MQLPYKSAAKRTPANPRPKTVCPALKTADAPDLVVEVLEAVLPPVVPLPPDPPEVGVPLELPVDMPEDTSPVADEEELPLTMAVPLGPATAVKVELAAELTPVATMTSVVLLLMAPDPMPLMLLIMLLVGPAAMLLMLLEPAPTTPTGAGMPGEPEMYEAAAGCEVTADARAVTTDGWLVMTDGIPVTTPRESVWLRYEVNGLFWGLGQYRLRMDYQSKAVCLMDGCCKDNCRTDALTYEEDEAMACGALVVL